MSSLHSAYHVVSKLVTSCKDQIKQFYFINKQILVQFMEDNDALI